SETERIFLEAEREVASIFSILRNQTGVDFGLYKNSTIRRRLLRRVMLTKSEDLSGYLKRLRADPSEVEALHSDLLINVTSFFRDPQSFHVLKRKALPKLEKNRPTDAPL